MVYGHFISCPQQFIDRRGDLIPKQRKKRVLSPKKIDEVSVFFIPNHQLGNEVFLRLPRCKASPSNGASQLRSKCHRFTDRADDVVLVKYFAGRHRCLFPSDRTPFSYRHLPPMVRISFVLNCDRFAIGPPPAWPVAIDPHHLSLSTRLCHILPTATPQQKGFYR